MPPEQEKAPAPLGFHGVLVDGLGQGQQFTTIDWVRRRFQALLGIAPYPGTVNLRLKDDADRAAWAQLRYAPGIPFPPEQGFCAATCYRVTIRGTAGHSVPAAIVLPHVPDYPPDKVELVAAVNVRQTLGLRAGDRLTIYVHL
jgi:CTP-dependent riboflavin kinase